MQNTLNNIQKIFKTLQKHRKKEMIRILFNNSEILQLIKVPLLKIFCTAITFEISKNHAK